MSLVAIVALAIYGLLLFGIICWKGVGKMRKDVGIFFVLISAGFLYSMATKPKITWDSVIADNGSHYTNDYSVLRFKWRKTLVTMPNTTPLYISRRAYGTSGSWEDVASTTVAPMTYDLTVSSTNFEYYLWCDYLPPTPVHTNGVWLGQIIEKAKGDTGLNRLIIINSKLLQNGKVIAP